MISGVISIQQARINFIMIFVYSIQSNSIKETLGGEIFFTVVKGGDHYLGGTEIGLAFLQREVAWIPYTSIGYLSNQAAVTSMYVYESVHDYLYTHTQLEAF